MNTKSYIFYGFIEYTSNDYLEYFYTKEEGIKFM